jgi:hypothetical protein
MQRAERNKGLAVGEVVRISYEEDMEKWLDRREIFSKRDIWKSNTSGSEGDEEMAE